MTDKCSGGQSYMNHEFPYSNDKFDGKEFIFLETEIYNILRTPAEKYRY